MKTLSGLLTLLALSLSFAHSDTTFGPSNHSAYGANVGWVNLAGDITNGVIVGETYLSGNAYAGNCGWICFGNTPSNGTTYNNTTATNYGVNHDGTGNLSGYAYGANIGWINFGWAAAADGNRPRFDLSSGSFSGYAYSSNCGWIALGSGFLSSATLLRVDTDGDGISDAWERKHFGNLTAADASSDSDGDGVSDVDEYVADTAPLDSNSFQKTSFAPSGDRHSVTIDFTSKPTRRYRILMSTDLTTWIDSGLGVITPDAGSTTHRTFGIPTSTRRFFRVQTVLPLSS